MTHRKLAMLMVMCLFVLMHTYVALGQTETSYQVVFTSDAFGDSIDLYSMSLSGATLVQRSGVLGRLQTRAVQGADCLPNGDILFAAAFGLYRVSSNSIEEVALPFSVGLYSYPRLSADRTHLAFSADYAGQEIELYTSGIDGLNQLRLTNNNYVDTQPAWSPDGLRIAYVYREGNTSGIAVVNSDGTHIVRLTQEVSYEDTPAWSPNGEWIIFSSNRTGTFQLFMITPDGTNLTQLTSGVHNNVSPIWAPSGAEILFASDRDGVGYQLYRANADGSNIQRISTSLFDNSNNFPQCLYADLSTDPTATFTPTATSTPPLTLYN